VKRFLFVAFSFQVLSGGRDAWFGPDKAKHFFLGAFVQSASFGVLRSTGLGKSAALAGASGVTLSASVAKELRDRVTGRGTPSFRDFTWSLAGAAAVSPLLLRSK
jgi:uncharacterized protein YfiM (DUF2279 family)